MADVVYVVMIEDRHTDVEVLLFSTEAAALAFAEARVQEEYERHEFSYEDSVDNGDMINEADLRNAGWLYHRSYNSESDCVRVMARLVDAEVK